MKTREELDAKILHLTIERDSALRERDRLRGVVRERDRVIEARQVPARPIALVLTCPICRKQHLDEQNWLTKLHRTHRCTLDAFGPGCGHKWRPCLLPTVGVRYEDLKS